MLIELVNLGRDSELRYTQNGTAVLSFAAAYDVGFGDNKKTQWIECAMFGKKAESLASYLVKGKQIQISARDVRIETWQKNDGSGEGCKLACTVDDIKFCRDGQGSQSQGQQGGYSPQQGGYQQPQQNCQQAPQQNYQQPPQAANRNPNPPPAPNMDDFDSDIPF